MTANNTSTITAPVSAGPTPVSTMLNPMERINIDVMAQGAYHPIHRESLDQIESDIKKDRTRAIIVSASSYSLKNRSRLSGIIREFPAIPTYAILTKERWLTPLSAHSLGVVGIQTMIDVRSEQGWKQLRRLLARDRSDEVLRKAVGLMNSDLAGCYNDCWKFFEILFEHEPAVSSVKQLAQLLNILPNTLLSRFYKKKLPSPKLYIDLARMVRAARMLENKGFSVSMVSSNMGFSSPQSFSRHCQAVMKITPAELRNTYDGEKMLMHFRDTLVVPYLDTLRSFRPVTLEPSWIPRAQG